MAICADSPSGEVLFTHIGLATRRQSHSSNFTALVSPGDLTNHSTSALESDEEDTIENEVGSKFSSSFLYVLFGTDSDLWKIRGTKIPLRQLKSPARRRSSNLMMTPIKQKESAQETVYLHTPPLILNPSCSGYFLEPVSSCEA
jgi:hypothetical protein